ncbi:MAG: FdhF/YdeP family oxidoreductase [Planctomycetes bacterium]|nr:FdhF/YdeP family oxidoreductase [Planctomycetota bacterium]
MNRTWRDFVPFGLLSPKPRHFREMFRIAWANRGRWGYARRILTKGVCDGCSLGPRGLRDDVMPGTHLCLSRLNLLKLNTMSAMKPTAWQDVESLRRMSNRQLQALGRLSKPLIRRRGEPGFTAVSWDHAIGVVADHIRDTDPQRLGFFVTSRGITNETYYVIQKVARLLGTNNIDLCARLCHAATVYGLKQTLGVGAPTCSLSDFIGTDLLFLIGTNLANNQPVAVKYIHYAKKQGTRVVVINPVRERGLERYWIPSIPSSALFGTRLMDEFVQVNAGGDIALMNGVLKHLIERDAIDRPFVEAHTVGFDELTANIATQSWEDIERSSGIARSQIARIGDWYASARTAVFCYSMGLTQHEFGVQNVKAVVNLALARGMIGRSKCGIMPIRGHSGVQGGGECGVDPDKYCGGFEVNAENAAHFAKLWGGPVPDQPGMRTAQMIEAMDQGRLDILYNIGGNLLETMPDPVFIRQAMSKLKLRVHQDIVLNTSALLDSETVVILPAQTRYEMAGGSTATSTERRIRFSPEIPGPRIEGAKSEWQIPLLIGRRVLGPAADASLAHNSAAEIREDISRSMPIYADINKLTKAGDHFQWGGPMLLRDGVCDNMPDGRGRFTPLPLPSIDLPDGCFYLTTRRGKQFNSMVHSDRDPLTDSKQRTDVFISESDARIHGLHDGDPIRLTSDLGTFNGHCRIARIKPRHLQLHWPEANVLIKRRYDPISGEPDYNTVVRLESADSSPEV